MSIKTWLRAIIQDEEVRTSKIASLKERAVKQLSTYDRIADRLSPSCGMGLAATISPDLAAAARAFNATMDELRALDPIAPATRLPEGS